MSTETYLLVILFGSIIFLLASPFILKRIGSYLLYCTLFCCAFQVTSFGQSPLNGTYQIGGESPDFSSFTDAIERLNTSGVSGPVIFNFAPGQYEGHAIITDYEGASCENTVIFQTDAPQEVYLTQNTSTPNYLIQLNNAKGVVFKNLIFTSSVYCLSRYVEFTGENACIQLEGNYFSGQLSSRYNEVNGEYWWDEFCNFPPLTRSDNRAFIAADNTTTLENITIRNNKFTYGDYSIFFFNGKNILIQDNDFTATFKNSIIFNKSNNVQIINNRFKGAHSGPEISVYTSSAIKILNNRINTPFTALYVSQNTDVTDYSLIANNFITIGLFTEYTRSSGGAAISLNEVNNVKVYHNAVNHHLQSYSLVPNGDNIKVRNNIFAHYNYFGSCLKRPVGNNFTSNYNSYYASRGLIIHEYDEEEVKFEDWQATSNQDQQSYFTNPYFSSIDDLYTYNQTLNGKGITVKEVKEDIDGVLRTSPPDIGAAEFSEFFHDAAIANLVLEPRSQVGLYNLKIDLKNNGSLPLDSITIHWSVSNKEQPPIYWTDILARGEEVNLPIGAYQFPQGVGNTIKIWVELPEDQPDALEYNNTITKSSFYAPMAGVYTIGGIDADFSSFFRAIRGMERGGIIGPVTFNVRDGIYKERLVLDYFEGQNVANPIIFQAENGDATAVIIENFNRSYDNYGIHLKEKAVGFHFKNMTIRSTNSSEYGILVWLEHSNNHTFEHLILENNTTSTSSWSLRRERVLVHSDNSSQNVFKNNTFKKGSYALRMTGAFTARAYDNVIENNLFEEQSYRAFVTSYNDRLQVIANTIRGKGIELSDNRAQKIVQNNIQVNNDTGIYINDGEGQIDTLDLVANNFVHVSGTNSRIYGIHLDRSEFLALRNNTVHFFNTNDANAAVFLEDSEQIALHNNILSNSGEGHALKIEDSAILEADYNNFYAASTNFLTINDTLYTTLPEWQKYASFDTHSFIADPGFVADSTFQVTNSLLFNRGLPFSGLTVDIEGEERHPQHPDIGADENTMEENCVVLNQLVAPVMPFLEGNQDLQINVTNPTAKTLSKVQLKWMVNGVVKETKLAPLAPNVAEDSVIIGQHTFPFTLSHDMKFWIESIENLPNTCLDTLVYEAQYPCLNGSYDIGLNAPHFKTITAAITALNTYQVCGPVIFELEDGTYDEQITIGLLEGVNEANTVTFRSKSKDADRVIWTYGSPTSSEPAILTLTNAHWLRFQHITLATSDTKYAHTVYSEEEASNNSFENIEFIGSTNLSTGIRKTAIFYSTNRYNNGVLIKNCSFRNGDYSIKFENESYGTSDTLAQGATIQGNTFEKAYKYNIQIIDQKAKVLIIENKLTNPSGGGIEMDDNDMEVAILQNYMEIDGGSGIRLDGSNPTRHTLVANNFINIGGSYVGISFRSYSRHVKVYYNTMVTTSSSAIINIDNTISDVIILNNHLVSRGGGMVLWIDRRSDNIISDYNNLVSNTTNYFARYDEFYTSIDEWRVQTPFGAHSVSGDPGFIGADDLHISNIGSYSNVGTPLPEVTVDIDGEPREAAQPDIGADEYGFANKDMRMLALLSPEEKQCANLEETYTVSVEFNNGGFQTQTNFELGYIFEQEAVVLETFEGSVPSFRTATYTFDTPLTIANLGDSVYQIQLFTKLLGDSITYNDTIITTFELKGAISQFNKMSPPDDTVGLQDPVFFAWSAGAKAKDYDFLIWEEGTDRPYVPVVEGIRDSFFELETYDLIAGNTYHWQILANGEDCTAPGPIRQFSMEGKPDLVIEKISIPTAPNSGQAIDISWVVRNIGNASTGDEQWKESIYLSPDTIFDNGFRLRDVKLESIDNKGALLVDEGYQATATVSLPDGADGQYYLFVIADLSRSLEERYETNNTAFAPIRINLSPPPDLQVSAISFTPIEPFSGKDLTVNWTVTNTENELASGPTSGNNWNDRIYLSTELELNIGNEDTYYLGVQKYTGGILQSEESYNQTKEFRLPEGILDTHYLHVCTDFFETEFEYFYDDNNCTRSTPVIVKPRPTPNLIVPSIRYEGKDSLSNSERISIEYEVQNTGFITTDSYWRDVVYLSTSERFHRDSAINVTSFRRRTTIRPGESKTFQGDVVIPYNLEESTYFLHLVADGDEDIFEDIYETDNDNHLAAFFIGNADIFTANIKFDPDSVFSGTEVSVTFALKNTGNGAILNKSTENTVYMATTPSPDFTKRASYEEGGYIILRAYKETITLSAKDSIEKSITVQIPDGEEGLRYILVRSDMRNGVFENLGEYNNVTLDSTTIYLADYPDLRITDVQGLPDSARVNDLINVTISGVNDGVADITGEKWVDGIYVSHSSLSDEEKPVLIKEIEFIESLPIGATYTYETSFEVPVLPEGDSIKTCLFYAIANHNKLIFEVNNSNNSRAASVVVEGPPPTDLKLLAIDSFPDSLLAGAAYPINWLVVNNGASTEVWKYDLWNDALYVHKANDSKERYFVEDWTQNGPVHREAIYVAEEEFIVPPGLASGYYDFYMVADSRNDITEVQELDNERYIVRRSDGNRTIWVTETPSPDLAMDSLMMPFAGIAGQPIDLSYIVTNIGDTATSVNWTDKIYLSDDLEIDESDIIVGTAAQTGVLQIGDSYKKSFKIFIPADLEGSFFLIAKADANDNFYEDSEENNQRLAQFVIEQPTPSDIIVADFSIPEEALVGEAITLGYSLQNIGNFALEGYRKDLIYLSSDSIFDISDVLVGEIIQENTSLAAKEIAPYNSTFLSPGLLVGNYHVIIKTDALNNLPELEEENNIGISPSKVFIDMQELPLQTERTTSIKEADKVYYRLEIPTTLYEETILVRLTSSDTDAFNELFISYNEVPTKATHDFSFTDALSSQQEIILSEVDTGTYYILATGTPNSVPQQTITLWAEIINFQIRTVEANTGGNTGSVTVKLEGAKFEELMEARLEVGDTVLTATNVYFLDSKTAYATFNLKDAAIGIYDVVAQNPGGESTVLEKGFTIVEGNTGGIGSVGDGGVDGFSCTIENTDVENLISFNFIHPSSVRPDRIVPFSIQFSNDGNVDVPVPTRFIISAAGAPLAFTVEELKENHQELFLEFKEEGGPPGILRPGARGTIHLYTKSTHTQEFIVQE